jgi:hypothetical protein
LRAIASKGSDAVLRGEPARAVIVASWNWSKFRVMTSLKPIDLHRQMCIAEHCPKSGADSFVIGVFRDPPGCHRFGIEEHAIGFGGNLANRSDNLANRCEVVADASKKINISRRSGNRQLPDEQHQGSLEDKQIPVVGLSEPIEPPFQGVIWSQLVEWPPGLTGEIRQSLMNGGCDVF